MGLSTFDLFDIISIGNVAFHMTRNISMNILMNCINEYIILRLNILYLKDD